MFAIILALNVYLVLSTRKPNFDYRFSVCGTPKRLNASLTS